MFRQDETIDLFFINNCFGDAIIDYSYDIKAGAINRPKRHWIPNTRKTADVYLAHPSAKTAVLQFYKENKKIKNGRLGIKKENLAYESINDITTSYYQHYYLSKVLPGHTEILHEKYFAKA